MTNDTQILPAPPQRVVILAFDDAQVLDVAGPAAVFAAANDEVATPAYDVVVASPRGGNIRTTSCVALAAEPLGSIAPDSVDMLLIAGGSEAGLVGLVRDRAARAWTCRAVRAARRYGSVCAGVHALAAWGLIDGRRVATHWRDVEALARGYPAIRVDAQALYVEDGPLWTSAGITTGIDMCLALVERDLGGAVATSVARRLVLYARRPGHQSQFSTLLEAQGAGGYSALLDWIAANLDRPLDVETLAAQAGQSVRSFHRRFVAATGKTPAAFVEALRLDRARTLLSSGTTLKEAAARSGFGSAERLARAFTRLFGVSPSVWRAVHAAGETRFAKPRARAV